MSRFPPSQSESIQNRLGLTLAGRSVQPVQATAFPWALLAPCFTCGKELKGYYSLCGALGALGWASLRFDFTGLGQSEGAFAATDLDSNVADLEDAAAHLKAHHAPPLLLIGHSLGGVAALLAAPRLPSLRGLVLVGVPADLDHLAASVPAIRAAADQGQPVATVIGDKRLAVGPHLLPSLVRHNLRAALDTLPLPLLLLHARQDEVVPFTHAERLAAWANTRATLIPLTGDHLFATPPQATDIARHIAAWASTVL